ncbi:hypothetical protein [Stenotrophomonas rhizophila]
MSALIRDASSQKRSWSTRSISGGAQRRPLILLPIGPQDEIAALRRPRKQALEALHLVGFERRDRQHRQQSLRGAVAIEAPILQQCDALRLEPLIDALSRFYDGMSVSGRKLSFPTPDKSS